MKIKESIQQNDITKLLDDFHSGKVSDQELTYLAEHTHINEDDYQPAGEIIMNDNLPKEAWSYVEGMDYADRAYLDYKENK